MQILATKIRIPPGRLNAVSRPRLLEKLNTALDEHNKLILISAPAGYGKTTLLTEWMHSLGPGVRCAWLALDESDNDPQRFAAYFLTALAQCDDSLAARINPILELPQLPPLKVLLTEQLNGLAALDIPLLLSLDDYHIITNLHIHELLEYFVGHQPAGLHIALTTREDPPLPLARLRARGQMVEIRARDLRFSTSEARQFFNLSGNPALAEETLRVLDERTEGWAVGLQLAALALQHRSDAEAFIATFRGSHRYVLDYLAEEVIRQQEEEIRRFLTQTCVMERFNASVCEALTGSADSRLILQRLEQANLFIISLDDVREWYRYHHLFADYLRSGLAQAEAELLYRKAALWHETNDFTFEGVRYALLSGDMDFAADMIERAVKRESTWSGGRVSTLSGWLHALPEQVIQARPLLGLHASRIAYLASHIDRAEKLLNQAENTIHSRGAAQAGDDHLLALAALYRGALHSLHGNVQAAFDYTQRALAGLPAEQQLARARATIHLAQVYELSGQTSLAIQTYLESSLLAHEAGVIFLAMNARCAAAIAQSSLGNLDAAAQICSEAIALANGKSLAPLGLAFAVCGAIACERNDLESAEKYTQDGLVLSRQGGLAEDENTGRAVWARLQNARGDHNGALSTLMQGLQVVKGFHVPRSTLLAEAAIARAQLVAGQIDSALEWGRKYQQLCESQPLEYLHEFEDLTLARILLANSEAGPALALLGVVLAQAENGGRKTICIETLVLIAQAHRALQNQPAAIESLSQALRLAAPQGFRRIFLDEGAALLELLYKARFAAPEFTDSLIREYPSGAKPQKGLSTLDLPEPLSEQEMRVMKLIMAGKTNREIAETLFISVGTAKWHVHHILQKLGVGNRAQAIARGHELEIEP